MLPVCSEQLYEIMYKNDLRVAKYSGKYKIQVGLVSYNEANIRVLQISVEGTTQYQLSSGARL